MRPWIRHRRVRPGATRGVAVLVALVAAIAFWVVTPAGVQAAPVTQTFTIDGTFTVPVGVSSVDVTVVGAGGGAASRGKDPILDPDEVPPPGGAGARVSATVTVTGGEVLSVVVGRAGQTDDSSQPGPDRGGAGGVGFGSGGRGGDAEAPYPPGAGGGGGGSAVSGGGGPLVVAGAGGGAGGPSVGGSGAYDHYTHVCAGLDAVDPADLGPECGQQDPPTGHDGGDGLAGFIGSGPGPDYSLPGGGGGGGWTGGAGGPAAVPVTGFSAGGGAGGSSHTDATLVSAVEVVTAANPGQDGWVVITYDAPAPTTTTSTSTTTTTLAPTTTTSTTTTLAPTTTTSTTTTLAPTTTSSTTTTLAPTTTTTTLLPATNPPMSTSTTAGSPTTVRAVPSTPTVAVEAATAARPVTATPRYTG